MFSTALVADTIPNYFWRRRKRGSIKIRERGRIRIYLQSIADTFQSPEIIVVHKRSFLAMISSQLITLFTTY